MSARFQHLVILALIGGLAFFAYSHIANSHDQSSVSAEVRISARQLDNGRTEFALQQRDGDGWGERVLARQRYFPAAVGHSRWLNSSPYPVNIALPAHEADQGEQVLRPELSPDMPQANLWVALRNGEFGDLEVTIQAFGDYDAYIFDVVVAAGGRSFNFCNTVPIFNGIPSQLGCESPDIEHESVDQLAAALDLSITETARFDCIRHNLSTTERSLWACVPREQ